MHVFDSYHSRWFIIYSLAGIVIISLSETIDTSIIAAFYILLLIFGAALREEGGSAETVAASLGFILIILSIYAEAFPWSDILAVSGAITLIASLIISIPDTHPETGEFFCEWICAAILLLNLQAPPSVTRHVLYIILILRFSLGLTLRILPVRIQFSRGQMIIRALSISLPLLLSLIRSEESKILISIPVLLSLGLRLFVHAQEIHRRISTVLSLSGAAKRSGLWRSYMIYYLIPFRYLQSRIYYNKTIGSGSLIWDIGAHLGNRTRVWLDLGATVRAYEPQPYCAAILANWFGTCSRFTLRPFALGSEAGIKTLHLSASHPTLSSISADWVQRMGRHPRFEGIDWDSTVTIEVIRPGIETNQYGMPDFVKIDVEGSELDILKAFDVLPESLCFEFLPMDRQNAFDCIEYLDAHHQWKWNFVKGESYRNVFSSFIRAPLKNRFCILEKIKPETRMDFLEVPTNKTKLLNYLESLRDDTQSGDVYATRITTK